MSIIAGKPSGKSSALQTEGILPKQILIVEDDYAIRESLKELLEGEGYGVTTAENGAIALNTLENRQDFSAVLLDLYMPVMDGRTFLNNLDSKNHGRRKIPIVIMTAAGKAEISSLKNEVILCKPLEIDLLLNTMERYSRTLH